LHLDNGVKGAGFYCLHLGAAIVDDSNPERRKTKKTPEVGNAQNAAYHRHPDPTRIVMGNARDACGPAVRLMVSGLVLLAMNCVQLPEVQYLRAPLQSGTGAPAVSPPCARTGQAEAVLSKRLADAGIDIPDRAALESAATGHALIPGNKVTLLFDGPQTLGAMSAAIASAKDSINLETFIFDQDELGLRFADLLISKQRAGVQVNILYDCVGTLNTPKAFFTRMREAGIHLCPFHPLNPIRRLGQWKVNHRDHRKILVVDGSVAFMGGANISGTYAHGSLFHRKSNNHTSLGWRDTHLKIEGPAVAALQLLFVENWFSQSPNGLDRKTYFPPAANTGDKTLRVLGSEPGSDFEIYRAYVQAIDHAARTIHLTAAYFVPDEQIVKALAEAVRRGVQVQIVLTNVTDSGLVHQASQSYYQDLLKAGIQVFQMNSSILHAKTAVIDGAWSTVGSTNLDMRSFLFNKEVNVIVLGDGFGKEMEEAFKEDLKNSTEVTGKDWARRSEGDRLKEWSARILGYWL
jgi:cardiolipin synthase